MEEENTNMEKFDIIKQEQPINDDVSKNSESKEEKEEIEKPKKKGCYIPLSYTILS